MACNLSFQQSSVSPIGPASLGSKSASYDATFPCFRVFWFWAPQKVTYQHNPGWTVEDTVAPPWRRRWSLGVSHRPLRKTYSLRHSTLVGCNYINIISKMQVRFHVRRCEITQKWMFYYVYISLQANLVFASKCAGECGVFVSAFF